MHCLSGATRAGRRFEFSEWVRAYARYLNEQLFVFGKIQYYQVRPLCFPCRGPRAPSRAALRAACDAALAEARRGLRRSFATSACWGSCSAWC